jgi:hypothetical protein
MKPALRLPTVLGLLGASLLIGSLAWANIGVSPTSVDLGTVKFSIGNSRPVTVFGVGGEAPLMLARRHRHHTPTPTPTPTPTSTPSETPTPTPTPTPPPGVTGSQPIPMGVHHQLHLP